jgi:hypothetical protein
MNDAVKALLEQFRPMIETAVRHGLGSLATLLIASAMSNPFAAALIAATGFETSQIVNAIVGVGVAVFVGLWSFVNGKKLQTLQ